MNFIVDFVVFYLNFLRKKFFKPNFIIRFTINHYHKMVNVICLKCYRVSAKTDYIKFLSDAYDSKMKSNYFHFIVRILI